MIHENIILKLIEELSAVYPLTKICKRDLQKIIKWEELKKDAVILKEKEVCKRVCYIVSGRVIIHGKSGEQERTDWILEKGDLFFEVLSYIRQEPSKQSITAIEPCVVLYITHDEVLETCHKHKCFLWVFLLLTLKYYAINAENRLGHLSVPPEERYNRLFEKHPEWHKEIELQYIRTFLGITESTWVRIRRNNYRKK